MKYKKYLFTFIHLFFISGILYAFFHFATTPKTQMFYRRLWAYESWIILSFYGLFVYLNLAQKEVKLSLKFFKTILGLNILLLIFPWGLFLLLSPSQLLQGLNLKPFWRILGGMSLLGASIYSFPYYFYRHRFSRFVLYFCALDNLIAAIVLTILYIQKLIPLIAFSTIPLLLYFSHFFFNHAKKYPLKK